MPSGKMTGCEEKPEGRVRHVNTEIEMLHVASERRRTEHPPSRRRATGAKYQTGRDRGSPVQADSWAAKGGVRNPSPRCGRGEGYP
jgi:hypothetical protein